MKILGLDIETTGLEAETSDLLEIGLVFYDTDYAVKNRISYKQLNNKEVSKYRIIVHRPTKQLKGSLVAFEMHQNTLLPLHKELDNQATNENTIMTLQSQERLNSKVLLCNPRNVLLTIVQCLADEGWIEEVEYNKFVEGKYCNFTPITIAGKNVGNFDLKYLNKAIKDFSKTVRPRTRVFDPTVMFFDFNEDMEALPDLAKCLSRAKKWNEDFPYEETVKHLAVDDAMDVINLIHFAGINGLFPSQLVNKIYMNPKKDEVKINETDSIVDKDAVIDYFRNGSENNSIAYILHSGDIPIYCTDSMSHTLISYLKDFFNTESARDYIKSKILNILAEEIIDGGNTTK